MTDHGASATTFPHRGIRGSVAVGDYLETPAAAAVRAVRRVGLCPGLDRQFGGEPQTIGLVVAQDPPPGSEVARGALVTLYVSAPPSQATDDPEEDRQAAIVERMHEQEPAPERETERPAARASTASLSAKAARPRRKRRTRPAESGGREHTQTSIAAEIPQPEAVGEREDEFRWTYDHEPDAGAVEAVPPWEQPTFEMRNIFEAGPLSPGRRRLYPRKPLRLRVRTCSTLVVAHKAIALSAVAVLALAMSLTVTRGHTASSNTAGPVARSLAPAVGSTQPHARPARPAGSRRRRPAAREHRRAHAPWRPRPHARAATAAARASRAAEAATEAPPQTGTTAGAPQAQSGGGPFSP